ncbi:MAG: AraC family ligand binding domain-containing protein [Lentisphaeria bacterium]|nr:MAG: AraC family ligand binding domain-containing protein [Lentisphaeria bacterium]
MYEQANRPFPDFPVDIPLPLYVCSVGKRGGESGSGHVPPLLSQFIGMTFCVRGSGVAYLFDRPFRMRENDVIFYYPHEEHRFLSDSEESVVAWVNFDGPLAMSIFSSYRFPRFFPLAKGFPEEIYRELLGCLPKSDHDSVLHATTQLFLLFEYLAGEKRKSFLESGDVVERALRYIKANLSNSELNVNTLCDVLHLSRSTFRKHFVEAMHVTPGNISGISGSPGQERCWPEPISPFRKSAGSAAFRRRPRSAVFSRPVRTACRRVNTGKFTTGPASPPESCRYRNPRCRGYPMTHDKQDEVRTREEAQP